MKIISNITDDRRASIVAIDDYDYVYVVDATVVDSTRRWCVHLVVSLGDDIIYDDATHDRVKADCDWVAYVAHVAKKSLGFSYRANL